MSVSLSSVMSASQQAYTDKLYRSVDRNYDNTYSKEEVSKFAAEYEESTGVSIDVDGLFEAYDVDIDGYLSSKEYEQVKADDALGMDVLFGAEVESGEETEESASTSSDLSSILSGMSNAQKNTLLQATWKAETTGNLINAMFGSNSLFSSLNALSAYNSTKSMFSLSQQMGTLGSSMSVNMLL